MKFAPAFVGLFLIFGTLYNMSQGDAIGVAGTISAESSPVLFQLGNFIGIIMGALCIALNVWLLKKK